MQTSSLEAQGGNSEEKVEGIGANGLIGLSCEQRKSNIQIELALSSGPSPCIH